MTRRILQEYKGQLCLSIVVITLVGTNIFLTIQNSKLRTFINQSKQFVTEVGYQFSDIPSRSLDGMESTISFKGDGKQTLLLIFQTSCKYCHQQYSDWKSLVSNIDRQKWRVIAVTSEDDLSLVRQHLDENGIQDVEVHIVSSTQMRESRLMYTPMTLVLDSSGVVQKVWSGLWKRGFDISG